jgi:hypothetical protein
METNKSKQKRLSTYKAWLRKVEKENEKFEKATRAEKIVTICQDILALHSMHRIEANHGDFLITDDIPDSLFQEIGGGSCKEVEVSSVLKRPDFPVCNVCQIGGVMYAATLRKNKVTTLATDFEGYFYNQYNSGGMSQRADDIFGRALLRDMEAAFEGGEYGYGSIEDTQRRFIAAYKNLIKNEGKKFTWYKSDAIIWELQ